MATAVDHRQDGRAARWNDHKAQRKAEVLDIALDEIDRNGIDVSVKQIADRLGITRPVLYRHFNGREDLDEQIRQRVLEDLFGQLAPALKPDGTLESFVQNAVSTYVRWIDRHPNLHRFLGAGSHHQRIASAATAQARQQLSGQMAGLFATVLGRVGVTTELARPYAFGVIGMVDSFINAWRADPASTLHVQQVVDTLTESILAMLEANARSLRVQADRTTVINELFTVSS